MHAQTVKLSDAVTAASSELVTQAAAQLGTTAHSWPFLAAASSLREGRALKFIESLFYRDPYVAPSPAEITELAEYLALSSASHVLDGWRYVSQAALAFLSGSRMQGLHLAYYAELRAALAILSRAGVAILRYKHFTITASGEVRWFNGKTHSAAWDALSCWADQPGHGLEVVKCFSSSGLTGEEWAAASGARVEDVAESWIRDWSIDLHLLKGDSEIRNEASYRPNLRSVALALTSQNDVRFVRDVSLGCSPIDSGQFDNLDKAVIYDLCKTAYRLTHGQRNAAEYAKYWRSIARRLVVEKGLEAEAANQVVNSVRKALCGPARSLVMRARKANEDFTGVFSRAFLLLRLASALLRLQWKETRLRKAAQPWQDTLILDYVSHSLVCDHGVPTRDYTILRADQDEAIEQLDQWLTTKAPFNPYTMWIDQSKSLASLCRFERVGAVAVAL